MWRISKEAQPWAKFKALFPSVAFVAVLVSCVFFAAGALLDAQVISGRDIIRFSGWLVVYTAVLALAFFVIKSLRD